MTVRLSHGHGVSPEEFDERYVSYFSRPDITGWEARKAINDLSGEDMVPEPKIIIAAMHACRRLNDHSLAVRMLEGIKFKCGHHEKTIWPFIMQEIGPTLKELGISSIEEMGYDKPELAVENVFDIH